MSSHDTGLDIIRKIEICLLSSDDLNKWRKSKEGHSLKEKAKLSELMLDVSILRGKLETDKLRILADKFDELAPELEAGRNALTKEIEEMKEFIKALETVGKLIGMIGKVVAVI